MIKERIWVIEIRPYAQVQGRDIPITGAVSVPNSVVGRPGAGTVTLRGWGEGKLEMETTLGTWVEWSRSASFDKIRAKALEAISKYGGTNVRIVEVHELSLSIKPDA